MKKQLLFILLLTSILSVKAQVSKYYPFPITNAYWGQESSDYPGTGSTLDYYDSGLLLNNDTVLGGKTYHKLYLCGGASYPGGTYNSYAYNGAFREDTAARKVYMWVKGVDSLWYNFNLNVNDSIGTPSQRGGPNNVYGTNYVYSIDSVLVFGNYRKRINVGNSATNNKGQIICSIIEGIGGTNGAFGSELAPIPFESSISLLCFRQNTDTIAFGVSDIYGPGYSCHEFGPLGVNELKAESSTVTVYPNPGNGKFSIQSSVTSRQPSVVEVYNMMGEKVYEGSLPQTPKGALSIIDLSNQPAGIYLYRIITETGGLISDGKLIIKK